MYILRFVRIAPDGRPPRDRGHRSNGHHCQGGVRHGRPAIHLASSFQNAVGRTLMDVALPQSVNGNMRYYSLAPYNHVTIEEGEDGTPRPWEHL